MNIKNKIIDGHQVTMAALRLVWQHKILFVYAGVSLLCARFGDLLSWLGLFSWLGSTSVYARVAWLSAMTMGSLLSVCVFAFFVHKVFLITDGHKSSLVRAINLGATRYVNLFWYAILVSALTALWLLVTLPRLLGLYLGFALLHTSTILHLVYAVLLSLFLLGMHVVIFYMPILIVRETGNLLVLTKRSAELMWHSWLSVVVAIIEVALCCAMAIATLYAVWFVLCLVPFFAHWLLAVRSSVLGNTSAWLFTTVFDATIVLLYLLLARRERDEIMSQIPPML